DRLAPQTAHQGHPRGGIAGNPRHRPVTQTCLAAPFRHAEGDRAGLDSRSRQGSGGKRRGRPQGFRVFPLPAGLSSGPTGVGRVIRLSPATDDLGRPGCEADLAALLEGRMDIATTTRTAKVKASLSIPNILTCARIAAIPVVIGCIYAQSILDYPLWLRWVAVAVFIAAGITDYLDGYYARAWNQQSAFGRMLDPIAPTPLPPSCPLT